MNSHHLLRIAVLLSSILVTYLYTSCFPSYELTEETEEPSQNIPDESNVVPLTRDVIFSLSPFTLDQIVIGQQSVISEQNNAQTRADDLTISQSPTRLLVLDVVDGQVLQQIELTTSNDQVTDGVTKVSSVTADLKLTLTYGTHNLYLVAAVKPYQSFDKDNLTVTWNSANRPSYVWANKVEVVISQTSAGSQSVSLPLVVGQVLLVCNDKQDTNTQKIQVSGPICLTLNLGTMKGVNPSETVTYSLSLTNHDAGLKLAVFSFAPSEGSNLGNITFSALKSDNSVIASHTLPDVPLSAGNITRYTGNFYNNITTFALSTTNQWTAVEDKTY